MAHIVFEAASEPMAAAMNVPKGVAKTWPKFHPTFCIPLPAKDFLANI